MVDKNFGLICKLKKGAYYDSVFLMEISEKLRLLEDVSEAIIGMGTETNKNILSDLNMLQDDLINAIPDDLMIAIKTKTDQNYDEINNHLSKLFDQREITSQSNQSTSFPTLSKAISSLGNVDLVLISTPGQFAFEPAFEALMNNIPVLIFSDHVDINQEIELKKLGSEKNILVMGPDCGACNLNQYALALSSQFRRGTIGIIGASGSGVQEVGVLLDSMGIGVSQIIGTGGRDLSEEIAASSMLTGLDVLSKDPDTELIILVGKKPSPKAEFNLKISLQKCPKPVICCFLGSSPKVWNDAGAWYSPTLSSAALTAKKIKDGEESANQFLNSWINQVKEAIIHIRKEIGSSTGFLRGIFGAGTFSTQAQLLSKDLIEPVFSNNPIKEGKPLKNPLVSSGHSFVDVGDEFFTQGRPHPVVDPLPYKLKLGKDIIDEETSIILFDVILGPAVHKNPSEYISRVIKEFLPNRKNKIIFVASVCGTDLDPQNATNQRNILSNHGVIVLPSSSLAALVSILSLTNISIDDAIRITKNYLQKFPPSFSNNTQINNFNTPIYPNKNLHVINIGTSLLAQSLLTQGATVSQIDWMPPAGGDTKTLNSLRKTKENSSISKRIMVANEKALNLLLNGQPVWIDVKKAGEVVPGFQKNLILHAGPAISWNDMIPAQKGGVIGGILFEGLANNEEEAIQKVLSGDIILAPGLDFDTPCGAMASTSWSMPVAVVVDKNTNNYGYTALQEGPFMESLRWGNYSKTVIDRWKWMRDDFGPALSRALRKIDGIQMRPIISRSLQMGDENHSRELSTNTMIALELSSALFETNEDLKFAKIYLDFIKSAERFALHILMASAMSVLRSISDLPLCSLVTAMGGNGVEIGIKLSGTGKSWFTAPAPIPVGKYLNPSWTSEDAIPFAGDSCVLEVYGLGGMAGASSPSIALLTGGTYQDAVKRTKAMSEITQGKNSMYQIPFLDFEGVPTGINIIKVLETGIEPISHAGIALKTGGQAGAGVASIPIDCFIKAFNQFTNTFED